MSDETEQQGQQDEGATTEPAGNPGSASESQQGQHHQSTKGTPLFTAEQEEHIGKLLARERALAERRARDGERRQGDTETQQRAEIEELREQLAEAQSARVEALRNAEGALADAQIMAVAAQRGIPSDRLPDAVTLMNKSGIKVDLKARTVTGVEEAVQALVEAKPWLVGSGVGSMQTQAPRPVPNLNGGIRTAPASQEAQIAQAMEDLARNGLGRI